MMTRVFDIIKKLKRSAKTLLTLVCVLFLSSCDDCPTVQYYLSNGTGESNCFLCSFFKIITQTATNAANQSWDMFSYDLSQVVMVATVIYIAFFTLKSLGSFGKLDTPTYLSDDKKGVVILGFKMAVICVLLTDESKFFVNGILIPMFVAGLKIGGELSNNGQFEFNPTINNGWGGFFEKIYETVLMFNDSIYYIVALGKALNCHATNGFFLLDWDLLLLIYGAFLFAYGWFLLIAVSFYIIDILLTLTFGAVLLPFGIAFYVSGQTMGYSKRIWQLFLNAFFSFIMLGVILCMIVNIIDAGMGKGSPGAPTVTSFLSDFNKSFNDDQIESLSEELMETGRFFLTLIGLMMVGALVEQINELVDSITGGAISSGSTGKSIGAAAMKPAVNVGQQAGKYAGDAALSGIKYAGDRAVNNHFSKRLRKNMAIAIQNKTGIDLTNKTISEGLSYIQGRLTGTGRMGHKFWTRGRNH